MMNPAPETAADRDLRRLRTLYRALGDETRLRVIGLLAELGPMPVNRLSARVGLSQPATSERVKRLEERGLIEQLPVAERAGAEVLER